MVPVNDCLSRGHLMTRTGLGCFHSLFAASTIFILFLSAWPGVSPVVRSKVPPLNLLTYN